MSIELKVGDIVDIHDGSYSFGIRNGVYDIGTVCGTHRRIIQNRLKVMKDAYGSKNGEYCTICDLFVTDDKGGFWFTRSKYAVLHTHVIVIDGKNIEISHESFENLKKQLL